MKGATRSRDARTSWDRAQHARREYISMVAFSAGSLDEAVRTYMSKETALGLAAGLEYRMVHVAADSFWEPENMPLCAASSEDAKLTEVVESMQQHTNAGRCGHAA